MMWKAVVAALALTNGALGFTIEMVVPPAPAPGTRVELAAPYTLAGKEYVDEMTWTKDGNVFMRYQDNDGNSGFFETSVIQGMNMNVELSHPQLIVLDNVTNAASGQYGLSMTVIIKNGNSISTNRFQKTLNMRVGGRDSPDTLGSRFGGRPAAVPPETTVIGTFSAGSTDSRPVLQAAPAGNAPPDPTNSLQEIANSLAQAQANVQAAVEAIVANLGV